jgi:catechol 2,3-dioxygenase-like lactoylglutathione lyase family enzyme
MIYIKHVGIYVDKIEQLSVFYQKIFDMHIICDKIKDSGELYDQLFGLKGCEVVITKLITPYGKETGYGEMLELIKPLCSVAQKDKAELSAEKHIYQYGTAHISFGVDDIQETVKSVIEQGGKKKTDIIIIGNRKCCFVVDPEGNWIELIQ